MTVRITIPMTITIRIITKIRVIVRLVIIMAMMMAMGVMASFLSCTSIGFVTKQRVCHLQLLLADASRI